MCQSLSTRAIFTLRKFQFHSFRQYAVFFSLEQAHCLSPTVCSSKLRAAASLHKFLYGRSQGFFAVRSTTLKPDTVLLKVRLHTT